MVERQLGLGSWAWVASVVMACGGDVSPLGVGRDPGSAPTALGGASAPVAPSAQTPPPNPVAAPASSTLQGAAPTPAAGAPAQTDPSSTPASPAGDNARGLAMDECDIATKWQGDEYCIKAPPPDKGFQLHIGPSNYDNPDARYVLEPGQELTENFQATSGNEQEIYYYFRQYRMRPGSHHMIVAAGGQEGRRLGGSQNSAKDNPERGVIAPENDKVGMKLGAKTPLTINLHYINMTDKPILKEVWVNFWYRDPSDVSEPALEMFSMAPMNIPPGQHVLVRGDCPITKPGRVLQLYGHRHANNRRFSVFRKRAGQEQRVYEDYDWEHPLFLEFSSVVTNTPADPMQRLGGGFSGPLDLAPGDTLAFECDIVNSTDKTFVGRNEAVDDEMCIMVGDTVGSEVSPRCMITTTPL